MEQTLYEALKAAGVAIEAHESDLYLQATTKAFEILANYPDKKKISQQFRSRIAPHSIWIEVPFAYDPFWTANIVR